MFPGGPGASVSPPDYVDYRDATQSVFEEFSEFYPPIWATRDRWMYGFRSSSAVRVTTRGPHTSFGRSAFSDRA
jgi:hypothetical protein